MKGIATVWIKWEWEKRTTPDAPFCLFERRVIEGQKTTLALVFNDRTETHSSPVPTTSLQPILTAFQVITSKQWACISFYIFLNEASRNPVLLSSKTVDQLQMWNMASAQCIWLCFLLKWMGIFERHSQTSALLLWKVVFFCFSPLTFCQFRMVTHQTKSRFT